MGEMILVKQTPQMKAAKRSLDSYKLKLLKDHTGELTEAQLDRYLRALERYQTLRLITSACRSIPKERWPKEKREELDQRSYGLKQMAWALGLSISEGAMLNHYMINSIFPSRAYGKKPRPK